MDALGVTVCGSVLWTVGLSTCIPDLGFNAPEPTTTWITSPSCQSILRSRLSRLIEHYNSISLRECVKCTTVKNVLGVPPKSQLQTKYRVGGY